ncbi:uncharacterized protein LOC142925594 [Petromyzon marinus]|uniref:uncharacterized protein LOC142925594 n=1 Tax=Petromyzon marinus TaxID=7757 RepID=UPI003F720633
MTEVAGACQNNPCGNSGICVDQPYDYPYYRCYCIPPWSGSNCENYGACQNNPCGNWGTCVDQPYDFPYYRCNCIPPWYGSNCEYYEPPTTPSACQNNPCGNSGTCVDQPYDYPYYRCYCIPPWSGSNCENYDVYTTTTEPSTTPSVCQNNPCGNRGTCVDQPYDYPYYRCDCIPPWSGSNCEYFAVDTTTTEPPTTPSVCQNNPCGNWGTCVDQPYDFPYYRCDCIPPWYGSNCEYYAVDTTTTEPPATTSVCQNNPCGNWGTCVDQPYDFPYYRCDCIPPWYGSNCEYYAVDTTTTATPATTSVCQNNPCGNWGTCVDQPYDFPYYRCYCIPPWSGSNCENYDVDTTTTEPPTTPSVCQSSPCANSGTCVEQPYYDPFYRCYCIPPWSGSNCEYYAVDTTTTEPPTTPSVCQSSPCANSGTCVEQPYYDPFYRCYCIPPWSGSNCEYYDVDTTTTEPPTTPSVCQSSPCANSGTCVEQPYYDPFYRCYCIPPWSGSNCEYYAVDTTTTEPPTTPSVCQSSPCANSGTCVEQPYYDPFYRCYCIPPWSGSNCEYYAVDTTTTEPPTTPSVCQNNPCGNWGTCVDQPYDFPYYRCDCIPPWYGSNCEYYAVDTTTTEPPTTTSVCQSSPCVNSGTCVEQPYYDPFYRCYCIPPWSGSNCEYYDVDTTTTEPPTTPSVCQNNPCGNWGTCVDQPYDFPYYRCDCIPPWYGSNCEYYAVDTTTTEPPTTPSVCQNNPCGNWGTCVDQPYDFPYYRCDCIPPWYGSNCEYYAVDTTTTEPPTTPSACQSSPCLNSGFCVDQQYDYPYYRCYCIPGTSGARCEYSAGCLSSPCLNGGTCSDLDFPYHRCVCNSRWSGLNCENPVREVELMNCTSRYMELQIPLSELSELGLSPSDVHLEDPSCRGSISGQYLVLHTDLLGCGSTLETHDSSIVYSNTAYGFVAGTRAKKLRIPMHCYLGAEGRVIASFAPRVYDKYSSGTFDLSIAIYTSQAFSQAVRAYPFEVDLGAPIYAEVLLNSYDNSLQLLLETCKASPNPGATDSESYIIIRDGCQVDPSYATYSSGDEKRQHFSFQSVEFFSGSQVYLECNVRVCNISDVSSRCRRGCVRSKRSVRDLVSPENRAEHKVDLSQGPVLLRKTRQVSGLSSSTLGLVYALAAVLTVAAVCMAVVRLYGVRSRATQYELIVPIDD